ncbi:MAG: hypothetical protein VW683_16130, partial [Betaproteobacteria bacterium]
PLTRTDLKPQVVLEHAFQMTNLTHRSRSQCLPSPKSPLTQHLNDRSGEQNAGILAFTGFKAP